MATYHWRTDVGHGECDAENLADSVQILIAEGEWAAIDSAAESRDLADGAWMTVFADGVPVYRRGTMP